MLASQDHIDQTTGDEAAAVAIDWAQAACRTIGAGLTTLFFSDRLDDIARAKELCGVCPVRQECLAGAIARREPAGVWGGHLFLDGRVLAFKRPRGRPRKDAVYPAAQVLDPEDLIATA